MAIYWPRAMARIFVPTAGTANARVNQEKDDTVFQFDLRPTRLRLEANNFNEADEATITVPYDEAGLDPRFLKSAEVYIYLADAFRTGGDFTPDFDSLRFLGIARDVSREFDTNGKTLTIKAQDYTCLFLEAKNFPQSGIPLFSDTLQTAWERICDNTGYWDLDTREIVSTVTNLRDRLVLLGDIDQTKTLGSAVPARIAKLGRIQLDSSADAWAVWQHCVSSLGLISWIRNDRCFVANATDFYTADDPPRFVWGLNIEDLKESRELGTLSAKNVGVRAYDPLSGKALESLFPPQNDPHILKKKKLGASAAKRAPKIVHTQDYELFDLPFAVADQATLDKIAERIWEERTRQELRGSLKTREMFADTVNGSQIFDLLKLGAGDQIQIEIDRDALDDVQSLSTIGERTIKLLSKGYSPDVAKFIAANLDAITSLPPQFLVHSVTTEMESSGREGGSSYTVSIEFLNRIDISGAATNQADGTNQPPLEQQKMNSTSKSERKLSDR